jgi:CubicO group peptidase (beta-lactamase class C family)
MATRTPGDPARGSVARRLAACIVALPLVAVVGCSGSDHDQDGTPSPQERIAAAVDRQLNGDAAFDDVSAVVLQANGDTVFERYRESAPGDYHAVWSVTKSVVSTLVGYRGRRRSTVSRREVVGDAACVRREDEAAGGRGDA